MRKFIAGMLLIVGVVVALSTPHANTQGHATFSPVSLTGSNVFSNQSIAGLAPLGVTLNGLVAGGASSVPIALSNPNVTGNFLVDSLAVRSGGYGTACSIGNGCIPALNAAGTFVSATLMNYTDAMASDGCSVELRSAGGTGTTPTLNVYVQGSIDQSNWHDRMSFTQVTTSASNQIAGIASQIHMAPAAETDGTLAAGTATDGPIPNAIRLKFIVGGTTPNYATVSVNIWCH